MLICPKIYLRNKSWKCGWLYVFLYFTTSCIPLTCILLIFGTDLPYREQQAGLKSWRGRRRLLPATATSSNPIFQPFPPRRLNIQWVSAKFGAENLYVTQNYRFHYHGQKVKVTSGTYIHSDLLLSKWVKQARLHYSCASDFAHYVI